MWAVQTGTNGIELRKSLYNSFFANFSFPQAWIFYVHYEEAQNKQMGF